MMISSLATTATSTTMQRASVNEGGGQTQLSGSALHAYTTESTTTQAP